MRITIILMAFLFAGYPALAQKKSIPDEVMASFNKMYPEQQGIKWKSKKDSYQAKFRLNNHNVTAKFIAGGEWVETQSEIDLEDLPEIVLQSLEKKFPSGKYDNITRFENKNNTLVYIMVAGSKDVFYDVVVDAQGKIIKSEKRDNPPVFKDEEKESGEDE